MQDDPRIGTQPALTAVLALQTYVMARSPRLFDDETEEQFRETMRAVAIAPRPDSEGAPDQFDIVTSDYLAHNFSIAQCSVLLLFANRVQSASLSGQLAEVQKALESMWKELEQLHLLFFGEPQIS